MSHAAMEAPGDEWTKANIMKLLAAIKTNIPESMRGSTYNQGMKALDWQKVAFPPFSPEECEQKWREMFLKMRKIRSLTELIVEAEEVIADPFKNKKIHPAFPKRPKTAAAIYYSENYSKLQKQHPGMNSSGLLKIAIKEFKRLPDKAKAPYLDQFKTLFREYTAKKLELSKKYELSNSKCKSTRAGPENTPAVKSDDDEDDLPPKPPISGYILFCKEMSEVEDVPKKFYIREWSQRWRDLSDKERHTYVRRCKELKNQYGTKLRKYLMRFDEDKQQRILHKNNLKIPIMRKIFNRKHKKYVPGEPKQPSTCVHVAFFQEQMQLLKEIPKGKDRFVVVSRMWHQLSKEEKEQYKKKMHERHKKYSMELKEWFESLTTDEQKKYRKHNRRRFKFLKGIQMSVYEKENLLLKQASDSEDEDTDYSSSDDEEENILDLNEDDDDEEEEMEEDDDIFEVYW